MRCFEAVVVEAVVVEAAAVASAAVFPLVVTPAVSIAPTATDVAVVLTEMPMTPIFDSGR